MKLIAITALLVCQIAFANTYPVLQGASKLAIEYESRRLINAPLYAYKVTSDSIGTAIDPFVPTLPTLILSKSQTKISSIQNYSSNISLSNLYANNSIAETPQLIAANPTAKTIATFAATAAANPTAKIIATFASIAQIDPFAVRVEFDWKKPHGQWMHQLGADIKTARDNGDKETYDRLTKQYQVWADKYLLRTE